MSKTLLKELTEYADAVSEIRVLSAVKLDSEGGSDGYARKLRSDYQKIGRLGKRCREILRETVEPLLNTAKTLPEETLLTLQEFCEMLLSPASGEELDLLLLYEVSERLLTDLATRGMENAFARQLNLHISVCYANVNRTARITVSKELCTFYRDKGLEAAALAKEILYDKERYLRLDNEGRKYILRACRFYSALYDTFYDTPETNVARFQALLDADALTDDPFYRESVNGYRWELHRCRCLEHMGQLTERGNRWHFSREQCREISERFSVVGAERERFPEKVGSILPDGHYELIVLRNKYFAGELEKKSYQESLLSLYQKYANDEYDMYAAQYNLLLPTEYLSTFTDGVVTAREETTLRTIYHRVIDYILGSVNMGAFNFLQEYLVGFLENFIEIPGVMLFRDMGLYCLAALHPPTYVHSLQVADIARCLTDHLYREKPELFDAEFPEETESAIATRIYYSALCHDFGKIAMIDSIFIYGRDLFDREYEMIKLHPKLGASMLSRFYSTRAYAKTAAEHHRYFSGEGGYPSGEKTPISVAAAIIEAADCIDAATDTIGRSYHAGKTLSEVCAEIEEDATGRYAPYLAELLRKDEVRADLDFLLTEGRKNQYRKAYLLLSGVKDRLGS